VKLLLAAAVAASALGAAHIAASAPTNFTGPAPTNVPHVVVYCTIGNVHGRAYVMPAYFPKTDTVGCAPGMIAYVGVK
jgi:hypothetical protein